MRQATFAIPGDLATLTGGYGYARKVLAESEAAGWRLKYLALPGGFPKPSEAALAETQRLLAARPPEEPLLIDGLAFGALPAALLRTLPQPLVALVHHPLALEGGVGPEEAARLFALERDALSFARQVVAASPATARSLTGDYGVPAERCRIALPGTPRHRIRAEGSEPPLLLTVGTVTQRKAPDVLVAALARLTDLPWQSRIVGNLDLEPKLAATVQARIDAAGLRERILLTGPMQPEALREAYRQADLFVLPSRHEGYGMVFAEAMTYGLPIVACRAGAVPDTVPESAGQLVPVDDEVALASAIRALLVDEPLRRQLSAGAWQEGRRLPDWPETAAAIAAALEASLGASLPEEKR